MLYVEVESFVRQSLFGEVYQSQNDFYHTFTTVCTFALFTCSIENQFKTTFVPFTEYKSCLHSFTRIYCFDCTLGIVPHRLLFTLAMHKNRVNERKTTPEEKSVREITMQSMKITCTIICALIVLHCLAE